MLYELMAHKSALDCPFCASLEGMLENIDGAAFIVTKEGQVQTLNREAEGALRKADILRIRPDKRLAFNVSKSDEDLQAAILAAFDPHSDQPPTSFAIHYGLPEQKIVTVLPLRPAGPRVSLCFLSTPSDASLQPRRCCSHSKALQKPRLKLSQE
jgi:hypothetical protein